jgi:ribosomal protein S18 acetylase RimI-like enzyme
MTDSPRIRLVRPDDEDDLAEVTLLGRYVFYTTFHHTTSPANMRLHLDTNYTLDKMRAYLHSPDLIVHVAEVDDAHSTELPNEYALSHPSRSRIIAWYSLCTSSTAANADIFPPSSSAWPNPLELRTIHVHPASHGKGLARRMLDQAKEYARGRGHGTLWLGVYPENGRAIRFYEKCGFAKIGEHEFRVGEQVDVDDVMAVRVDGAEDAALQ